MTEHLMPGFEADDIMAFVAALGALRVMTEVEGDAAQLVWRHEMGRWRLYAGSAIAQELWAELIHRWITDQAASWDWGGFDNATMNPAEWARHAGAAQGMEAELWAALGSDGCRHPKGKIMPSRLEYAQGGGHQHWLASLRGAVERAAEGTLAPADIARVLWSPWQRGQEGLVCRWDWRCERDHALMGIDPTRLKMRQDHAATLLAAVGLASLPTAPTRRGLLGALAVLEDKECVRWPIWREPFGLADVEAMVSAQPLLGSLDPSALQLLEGWGVAAVMEVRRRYSNKLVVFSRGREVARTGSDQGGRERFAHLASLSEHNESDG